MHDPSTVAFEIKYPWYKKDHKPGESSFFPKGYRDTFITIWHVDPETDATDDSCGWHEPPLTNKELALAERLVKDPHDNVQSFFKSSDTPDDMVWYVSRLFRCLRREQRKWYQYPKWHFWHWQIQCHPLQALKRFLFSRCSTCGKRFPWGYTVCTNTWFNTGPMWFRSEKDVHHQDCMNVKPKECNA